MSGCKIVEWALYVMCFDTLSRGSVLVDWQSWLALCIVSVGALLLRVNSDSFVFSIFFLAFVRMLDLNV